MRPQISIDRDSKRIAIFDDFQIVREFESYTDEAAALTEARAWVHARTDVEPEVIYPQITSMKLTYHKPRRKR